MPNLKSDQGVDLARIGICNAQNISADNFSFQSIKHKVGKDKTSTLVFN
jgi:hypothetical protein